MKIQSIINNKGFNAVLPAIDATIADLKRLEYTKQEIKETLKDCFLGYDERVDLYIKQKGY